MMILTIYGRLGADPVLGNANGTAVLNMSVACDGWDPKAKEKMTTWVRVAYFGTRAEKLNVHLSKGSCVMCAGEARLTEYKGKQYLELSASQVALVGNKPTGESHMSAQNPPKQQPKRAASDDDDMPF